MSLFPSSSSSTGGRDPLLHLIGHPLPACIDSPCTSWATTGVPRDEGTQRSTVDLFLLSLEKPILLFLFPAVGGGTEAGGTMSATGAASSSSSSSNLPARACVSHLLSVQRSVATLQAAERKATGGELEIFGMSTAPVQELEVLRGKAGVEVSVLAGRGASESETDPPLSLLTSPVLFSVLSQFHLLSDSSLRFTQALELPTIPTSPSSSTSASATFSSPADTKARPLLQRLTLLLREGQVVGKDLLGSDEEAMRAGERALRLLEPHSA